MRIWHLYPALFFRARDEGLIAGPCTEILDTAESMAELRLLDEEIG